MKADYAPDDRNAYTSDFRVTFFDIGLFPGREQDMTSLGYTRSFISKKFRDYVGEAGMEAPQSINAISLSHALRVTKGIYWINGITGRITRRWCRSMSRRSSGSPRCTGTSDTDRLRLLTPPAGTLPPGGFLRESAGAGIKRGPARCRPS